MHLQYCQQQKATVMHGGVTLHASILGENTHFVDKRGIVHLYISTTRKQPVSFQISKLEEIDVK